MGDISVRLYGLCPVGKVEAGRSLYGSQQIVPTVYIWPEHHTGPTTSSRCFHIYHMEDFLPNQQSEIKYCQYLKMHVPHWWFTWARILSLSDRIVSRILVSELLFPELISSCSSCIIWSSWAETVSTSSLHLPINMQSIFNFNSLQEIS